MLATIIDGPHESSDGKVKTWMASLDTPMAFKKSDQMASPNSLEDYQFFDFIVICEAREGIRRTIIHAARRLQGETGLSYPFGSRVVDGIADMKVALSLQNYELAD